MNISEIWKYDLRKGNTDHPAHGACLFDAGMWLVYGKIGDNPPCSCPIIRCYAIGLNDQMPDDQRQRLKPFILRVVGNRDPEAEPARLHKIVLETARRIVPLVLARWPEHQALLRALADDATYKQIHDAAAHAAHAARAATRGAANAAAHAAALATANAAVHAATRAADAIANSYAAWDEAIYILDAALRIGKQSPEFNEAQVRQSVKAFDLARSTIS